MIGCQPNCTSGDAAGRRVRRRACEVVLLRVALRARVLLRAARLHGVHDWSFLLLVHRRPPPCARVAYCVHDSPCLVRRTMQSYVRASHCASLLLLLELLIHFAAISSSHKQIS